MTLENAYFIAEIVGVIAIIASLLFVGVQIRQNTRAMTVTTSSETINGWMEMARDIPLNDDFAALWSAQVMAPEVDLEKLTPKDHSKVLWWTISALKSGEKSHLLWSEGLLNEQLWEGQRGGLRTYVSSALVQEVWQDPGVRSAFGGAYAVFVDELIKEARDSSSRQGTVAQVE